MGEKTEKKLQQNPVWSEQISRFMTDQSLSENSQKITENSQKISENSRKISENSRKISEMSVKSPILVDF